ncbi:amidase [Gemmatimonas sp.]|uniref:amidase n=2 Tax=Gemmatimonas sp. TaxID=1962908 RepID=UPI00391F798F
MSILDRDSLNAFCRHTHVELPPTASGPLDGLTFGLKDLFDVAGHRTGFGSPDWLRTHPAADAHAPVLSALLAAGARLVGKTHTEEMAFSLTGENAHYGTPVNPAAPDRVPGGSSSGSASAVAGGLVDFAIGSDTGGSVRAPASFCGIYGIRPTHGRITLQGACPLAPIFDTCGWFARDADVLARVGHVLLGTSVPGPLPGVRLLVATDAFAQATPAAAAALAPAVAHVEALFGTAQPVVLAPEGLAAWFEVFRVLQYADIWQTHAAWVQATRPAFGPQVASRFEAVSHVERRESAAIAAKRLAIREHLASLLTGDTVLLMPTAPDVAPQRGLPPKETVAVRERMLALLCPAGLGGLPQLSLPLAQVDGLPVGLSLLAAPGKDEALLACARLIHGAHHTP